MANDAPQGRDEHRSVVIFGRSNQAGWSSIAHLASLAARYLDALLISEVPPQHRLRRYALMSGRRRPTHRAPLCLVIAASANDLTHVFAAPHWFSGFRCVVGLVTDSYWTEDIPVEVRRNRVFDHLFITSGDDLTTWQRKVGDRVSWLPWGADALGLGSGADERPWDILRVGRQPHEWENDQDNDAACRRIGMTYHPRPAGSLDWQSNQALLMAAYSSAKYTIAFSNLAHRSEHTHPTRAHITGRWTEALSCGLIVAGIPPLTPSVQQMLWPEALLDLGTTQRPEGLALLRKAVLEWTPARSRLNYLRSLQRLDWRWRLQQVAHVAGLKASPLEEQISLLNKRIAEVGAAT